MILSRQNGDNSALFLQEIQRQPDKSIVIVVKKHTFLPVIIAPNQLIACITEETSKDSAPSVVSKYQKVFYSDDMQKMKKPVTVSSSFSDKIMKNLLQNSEPAISDAAKYASFVYNELDFENDTELLVITATADYPDALVLLNPASPETHEKTNITKVICYPRTL